jgi:hypothetical protein
MLSYLILQRYFDYFSFARSLFKTLKAQRAEEAQMALKKTEEDLRSYRKWAGETLQEEDFKDLETMRGYRKYGKEALRDEDFKDLENLRSYKNYRKVFKVIKVIKVFKKFKPLRVRKDWEEQKALKRAVRPLRSWLIRYLN